MTTHGGEGGGGGGAFYTPELQIRDPDKSDLTSEQSHGNHGLIRSVNNIRDIMQLYRTS